MPGSWDLVLLVGFNFFSSDGKDFLLLVPSAEAWPQLMGARDKVGRLLLSTSLGGCSGALGLLANLKETRKVKGACLVDLGP